MSTANAEGHILFYILESRVPWGLTERRGNFLPLLKDQMR
jgi:hypothetical protein